MLAGHEPRAEPLGVGGDVGPEAVNHASGRSVTGGSIRRVGAFEGSPAAVGTARRIPGDAPTGIRTPGAAVARVAGPIDGARPESYGWQARPPAPGATRIGA